MISFSSQATNILAFLVSLMHVGLALPHAPNPTPNVSGDAACASYLDTPL